MKTAQAIKGLVAFGLLAAASSQAQTLSDTGPVATYFINGVNTLPDGAQASAIELAAVWAEQRTEPRGVRFGLAYNPTDGAMKDVVEAGIQAGVPVRSILLMLGNALGSHPVVYEKLIELQAYSAAQPAVTESVVEAHVSEYQNVLRQSTSNYAGPKLILVPHSQGNFFANAEYSRLTELEKPCSWVVGVATPASSIPSKGTYATLQRDRVIQAAALILSAATGNEPLPRLSPHDSTNEPTLLNNGAHAFIEAYMASGSAVRDEILNNINTARRLARPTGASCSELGNEGGGELGPPWSFQLRESSIQLLAQASCERDLISCPPYYTGAVDSINLAGGGGQLYRVDANSNFAQAQFTSSAGGQVLTAAVSLRHEVNSVAQPGPGGELYYPFGNARSNVVARWTLNATGLDRNNNPYTYFTYQFTGTGTSTLESNAAARVLPDESEDTMTGIWLCPFPRLYFVNTETGASFITQIGGTGGGSFNSGGSIAAGQYEVSLVAGGDQLTLISGQMDNGQYPDRRLTCQQDANYRLQITPPF